MTANDRELLRYYRAIRSWLPCTRKLKKQIMVQVQSRVQDYLTQNPDTDITGLQAEFGTPQTIAAAYVENSDIEEILRGLRVRRRIVAIVMTAVMIVLLSWAAVVTWEIVYAYNTFNYGYIVVEVE